MASIAPSRPTTPTKAARMAGRSHPPHWYSPSKTNPATPTATSRQPWRLVPLIATEFSQVAQGPTPPMITASDASDATQQLGGGLPVAGWSIRNDWRGMVSGYSLDDYTIGRWLMGVVHCS